MRRAWAFAFLLAVAAPGWAQAPNALQLFATGKYDDAVRAALAQNDAAGYALAARAALAEEAARDDPCLQCLVRAEGYARQAIALDPKLPEARVYLALSLGMEEHIRGPLAARALGYPGIAKHALEAALKSAPQDPWVLAAMGGWNLAIVHGGGPILAALFYGASKSRGLEDFAKAIALAPGNIPVRFQYALSLSIFDFEEYRPQIDAALAQTVSLPPTDAYDRLMQARATDLLALLKTGNDAAYVAAVRKFDGYPGPTGSPR